MLKRQPILLFLILLSGALSAQDTLPNFSVITRGNYRTFISWTNPYPNATQISIQRSTDSLKGFKTLLSVPDPTVLQNGFVDAKPQSNYNFYRLFIVLEDGKYLFSPSKRPYWDTTKVVLRQREPADKNATISNKRVIVSDLSQNEVDKLEQRISDQKNAETAPQSATKVVPPPEPEKFITIKRRDSILTAIPQKGLKAFRDSLLSKTKDTMVFRAVDTILIKPFVPKEVYRPSIYVFTDKEGNISIRLPEAPAHKYSIHFFDEKNNPVFNLGAVKESPLTLDKSNFLQSGWYKFELYEDGKLKEKNKFFIPKDF